eukprot:534465-Rhodomonas_salina.1
MRRSATQRHTRSRLRSEDCATRCGLCRHRTRRERQAPSMATDDERAGRDCIAVCVGVGMEHGGERGGLGEDGDGDGDGHDGDNMNDGDKDDDDTDDDAEEDDTDEDRDDGDDDDNAEG